MTKDAMWLEACAAMAQITARCSKGQYFAFVIDRYGRVRGAGYNGVPAGMTNCIEGGCPRAVNMVPSSTPYDHGDGLCWAVHAEVNAMMGLPREVLEAATIVVNGFCCLGCAKQIVGNGVGRVVCLDEGRMDSHVVRDLFSQTGVELVVHDGFGPEPGPERIEQIPGSHELEVGKAWGHVMGRFTTPG